MKQEAILSGVPETMLWTLHNRAVEAMRSDGIIDDKKCVEIYQSIEYDYEKSFGKAEPSHAIRSLDFDREINRFLQLHPGATVVNLGEGLETQRYRINEDYGLWISIDLPDAIAIRERYMAVDDKHRHISLSAIDTAWFEQVPKDKPVFIAAQGLFMYLHPSDVETFTKAVIRTFSTTVLMFDTIPEWLSKKTLSKTGWSKTESYTAPKMPWGINRSQILPVFRRWLGDKVEVTDLGYSNFPRGAVKWVFMLFTSLPGLRTITPSIVKISCTDKTK